MRNKRFLAVAVVFLMLIMALSGLVMAEETLRREEVDTINPDENLASEDEPLLISGEPVDEEVLKFEEDLMDKYQEELMAIDGVNAVMIMEMDGVRSVIVFVKEDVDIPDGAIPEELEGYPVIVEIDHEVTIMPYGADEDIAIDSTEEVAEEAEESKNNTVIYILIGVAVIVIIILLTRKGS